MSGHSSGPGASARLGSAKVGFEALAAATLPPLVVLNGCWSGSAVSRFGQDPFSLAVGAILGGADTVVAGVGRIGSEPSAHVANHMLRLIDEGAPVSTALSRAQRMVRDDFPGLSPYDWAGLITVGTGR